MSEKITYGDWIPVSERLPEIGENVLVATEDCVYVDLQHHDGEVWCDAVHGEESNWNDIIIYWLPIPPLPKGGKG